MNTNLNPEDFWPDVEKLLDKHYKTKRQRKAALLIISALIVAGTLFFYSSSEKRISDVSDLSTEKTMTNAKDNSIDVNRSEQKNKSHNNSPAITENNINEVKVNSTDKKRNTSGNLVSKNESNAINKSNSSLAVKSESGFSQSDKATVSGKNISEDRMPVDPVTSIDQKLSLSKTENIASDNNTNRQQESGLVNTPSTIHSAVNDITTSYTTIQSHQFSKFDIDKTHGQLNTSRGNETEEPKSKYPAEYRLEVVAGANQVSKSITGFENRMVENRRNSWETEVLTPQLNVALSRSTQHTSISLGLSYIQYGEKVNYDPAVKSKFLVDNSYWNTYTTTVTDTDTNFVYGFVYYTQQTFQRLDSNYINQTDTVEQTVINNNIVKSTGTNVISYVEMPLSVSYFFGKKKFKYGVSAGISAGMLVYSNGYYLNNQGNDVIRLNDPELFRKVIVNGQVGLELKYCLTPALNFLVRPRYQMNLNSIVKDEAGFKQKYSAVGVSAGVSFLIR